MSGNPLYGATIVLISVALGWPFVMMDGGRAYLEFLYANPTLVTACSGAWSIVVYFAIRQVASVLLMRGAGAKLRANQ